VGDTQAIGVAYRDQDLVRSRITDPQFTLTGLSTPSTPLTGSETFALNQSGVTKQTTIDQIFTAAHYGMFQDNNTQTNVGIGQVPPTGNIMLLRTTDFAQGVTIASNSRITISRAGTYNIQFSSQFSRAGGAGGLSSVEIWLMKNGANIAETNTHLTINNNGGKAVAAWNWLIQPTAGDYYQLVWYSTDANVEMWYSAAATNPARPETPSVIVTVTQVA
jgi:hypothetical protein